MKLQAKQYDGRTVRRVYDAAKTPLQRLLLSQVLPAFQEQELLRAAQVLDPLRLFHHLQDLQQALFHSTMGSSPHAERSSPVAVLPFCVARCIAGPSAANLQTAKNIWPEEVLDARAPHLVLPGKPEQVTDRSAPFSGTIACSSPVVPSLQTVEEGQKRGWDLS